MHLLYAVRFYRGFSFFIEALWIFPQKAVFSVPADAHKRDAMQHTARSGQSKAGALCQSAHLCDKNPDDCTSHPALWDRRISVGYACVACVYDTCCRDSHLPHSTQIKKPAHTPDIPEYVQTHKTTDYTRERYSPVLVSILITSSVSTKSGT